MIVVLEEPDADLDNAGGKAVKRAIRGLKSAGRAVVVVAHLPAVIRERDLHPMPEGVTLLPVLPVEVFIRIADRTPLAYLVKALSDTRARALRE